VSKTNPYTQRQYERIIKAALRCGLKVVGVKPDGTVLTEDYVVITGSPGLTPAQKPRDAREKLGV
jgi:hypothetical protein